MAKVYRMDQGLNWRKLALALDIWTSNVLTCDIKKGLQGAWMIKRLAFVLFCFAWDKSYIFITSTSIKI